MKVIVPLRPKDEAELQAQLEQTKGRADLVEIWLQEDFIPALGNISAIGVLKSVAHGGAFQGTDQPRAKVLQQALEQGYKYIDLDITENGHETIRQFPPEKLILSFHDFVGIPDNLEEIFTQMQDHGPAVYKFAVTTNTQEQLDDFQHFAEQFPSQLNVIWAPMGKLGQKGRKEMQDSWGQFYALDSAHATASGQPTLNSLTQE